MRLPVQLQRAMAAEAEAARDARAKVTVMLIISSWILGRLYRVSSETVYTCSLFVNCASHASLTIKRSIYFFSWIKIDVENGITLKN